MTIIHNLQKKNTRTRNKDLHSMCPVSCSCVPRKSRIKTTKRKIPHPLLCSMNCLFQVSGTIPPLFELSYTFDLSFSFSFFFNWRLCIYFFSYLISYKKDATIVTIGILGLLYSKLRNSHSTHNHQLRSWASEGTIYHKSLVKKTIDLQNSNIISVHIMNPRY